MKTELPEALEAQPVPLGYAPPPASRPWVRRAAYATVVAVVLVLLISVLLPSLNRSSHHPAHIKCSSNLRSIGQAVQMYANENRGLFPPDFGTLLITQDLTSEVFVCYSTNDVRADGPTMQAVAEKLSAGGHLSYVYTGKGMTLNSPANAVLAYEPLSNHGDGMNVLFADGRVNWIDPVRGRKLLAELDAGHNPPRDAGLP